MIQGFNDTDAFRRDITKQVMEYPAFVRHVDDPLGLHRVRCEIPGYMALTPWAFPHTNGGGSGDRGAHIVPKEGSIVFVRFLFGDDERPVYSGGSWGNGQPPADVRAAGKEAHKIQALEIGALGDLSFRATVDERSGHRGVKIYAIDTTDDEVVASLEFDLEQRGVSLFGLAGVDIQGRGFVNIEAPQVQINERLVLTKSGPI